MRFVIAVAALVAFPCPGLAQSPAAADREAILATVQKFFDTMTSRDVEGARSVVVPEARSFAVTDGAAQALRGRTMQEYLDRLSTGKETYVERFWNPEVRIHGSIAVVWTPYDFWVDRKFSHCGVDAFNLVKTPEGWKIAGAVYTVQIDGCAPSPLGPLK
jgi:hypothetical protein